MSLVSFSLINKQGKVKKMRRSDLKNTKEESEKWYVPARNILFLSYALAIAESEYKRSGKKYDLFLGLKNEGKESYVDSTKDFLKSFNNLSKNGSEGKFKAIAPFIEKDKEDIIKIGVELGVDFRKTLSCYIGKENHCGYCLACKLRQEGFHWANLKDPTEYLQS